MRLVAHPSFLCLFKHYYIEILIHFRQFFVLYHIYIFKIYTQNNSGCLRAELRFSAFDIIIAHRIISNAQLFYWINVATNITSYIFKHLSFRKILCWWHLRCQESERICRGSVAGYSWWYGRCRWSSCWHCIEAISQTSIPVIIKVKVWSKKSILFSAQQIWRSIWLPGTDLLNIWNTFRWL